MTDPLSITTGIAALVAFGLQTAKLLHSTLESYQKRTKTIRDLRIEVFAVLGALQELQEVVDDDVSEFDRLKLPLYCCATLCADFNNLLCRSTASTSDSKGSLRDWAKLQFRGTDIQDFRTTLAGYKSTIQIAIGAINMRSMRVTQACLDEYRRLIEDAKADLEAHLNSLEEKLVPGQTASPVIAEHADQHQLRQERESALQCLQICSEVSDYLEERQQKTAAIADNAYNIYEAPTKAPRSLSPSSKEITAAILHFCQRQVCMSEEDVRSRLQKVEEVLESKDWADSRKPTEEQRVRGCLSLCDDALNDSSQQRTNSFEAVLAGDDSEQYIVSEVGDLISAKNITAGARSVQVLGQVTNGTIQSLANRPRPAKEASEQDDKDRKK